MAVFALFDPLGPQIEHHGCSPSTQTDRLGSGGLFPSEAFRCSQEEDKWRVWPATKLCERDFRLRRRWETLIVWSNRQGMFAFTLHLITLSRVSTLDSSSVLLCNVSCEVALMLWLLAQQKPVAIKPWKTSRVRIRSWRFRRMLTNSPLLRKCSPADTWKWPSLAGKSTYTHIYMSGITSTVCTAFLLLFLRSKSFWKELSVDILHVVVSLIPSNETHVAVMLSLLLSQ